MVLKSKRNLTTTPQIVPPYDESSDYQILPVSFYEIQILNRSIFLNPPIEHIRKLWYDQFQAFTSNITGLDRLSSTRFELTTVTNHLDRANYAHLVYFFEMKNIHELINEDGCFDRIEFAW